MRTLLATGMLAFFTLLAICSALSMGVYLWLQLVKWYWGWRFRRAVNRQYPAETQPVIHLIRKAQK